MDKERRSSVAIGVILLLLGAWFLALQFFPDLQDWVSRTFEWPLLIVGVGVLLFIVGLLTGEFGMAIPATIVAGIGGLLYYQNATGNWGSWAYAWTLIPGFAGVGTFLMWLLRAQPGKALQEGGGLILTSLVLFLVFGSFLGGFGLIGPYWPVLLILLGLWIVARAFLRRR